MYFHDILNKFKQILKEIEWVLNVPKQIFNDYSAYFLLEV